MSSEKTKLEIPNWLRILALLVVLYFFLVSIAVMGDAFKNEYFREISKNMIAHTDPFIGLFIGLLATSIIQSSSTTTSMIVTFFAASLVSENFANSAEMAQAFEGAMVSAIPMIMGANIGTSVTNTIVSMAHIRATKEFKLAFAAATIHDFFNIFTVIVLFPFQYKFDFIGKIAHWCANFFVQSGIQVKDAETTDYYKILISFVSKPIQKTVEAVPNPFSFFGDVQFHAILLLLVGVLLLLYTLVKLVELLKVLVLNKAEKFFDTYIFRNAGLAMFFGVVLTVAVQSSSVTTSLIVPLAGAGILTLVQVYPFTLGANIGTTVTAIIAAAATTGNKEIALTIAFAHLLFNVFGISAIWPIPFIRKLPIIFATNFSELVSEKKYLAFVYVLLVFFLIPLSLIFFFN
ncbi:Na/Pi symporter [bacterium]|nr:Na/Pi symporter [bacterium]